VPVFAGDRITLQWIGGCQPTFSAAMIGFIEATFDDEAVKNRICGPVTPPTVPLDWLRVQRSNLANRACWNEHPDIGAWQATARLDPFAKYAMTRIGVDMEATAHLQRYLANFQAAAAKLDELLAVAES
jgi:hypothetical protein